MKKIITLGTFLVMILSLPGQTPMYFNVNATGTGANIFPFGNTATRKVQWRIAANSLGTCPPGNNITVVYFYTSNANSNTYPILNIKLKQNGSGLSGGGLFETGMTTVYTGLGVLKAGVTNGWMSFSLTTPFLYNPNQPLLLEAEHNATSGTGPYIWQSSLAGPGQGRQWGDYGQTSYTGTDANVVHFGIDVIPATPCTGVPPMNSILPSSLTTCPGIANPTLGLASTYSFGGLTYQWQSSTISPVGPFSSVPGATVVSMPVPTLATTTWYQIVVTCTNSNANTTLSPTQLFVAGSVTNTVPYYENFEGVGLDDYLPNCSWSATNWKTATKTYIAPNANYRVPHSGTKYASFYFNPTGQNYFYSNGIWLDPGITYSAGIWFISEPYANFTDLSLFVGPNQSPTGQIFVANTGGSAVSQTYKALGGTFSVTSSGLYYVGIRSTASGGQGQYLTWDDLEVTIPCTPQYNSPSVLVNLSTPSSTVCSGQSLTLTATGADSYTWNTGATGNILSIVAVNDFTYSVAGTSSLTGCATNVMQPITVKPSPKITALAYPPVTCPGKQVNLIASGASSYNWSNGALTANTIVNPSTSQNFTVNGTAAGCTSKALVYVQVNPLPPVTAAAFNQYVCTGEIISLIASGANSYLWSNNITANLMTGATPSMIPSLAATYIFTVTGTDQNSCSKDMAVTVIVDVCSGLGDAHAGAGSFSLRPNPASDRIHAVSDGQGEVRAELCDMIGKVIHSGSGAGEVIFDIRNLPNGIYFVRMNAGSMTHTLRFIKE